MKKITLSLLTTISIYGLDQELNLQQSSIPSLKELCLDKITSSLSSRDKYKPILNKLKFLAPGIQNIVKQRIAKDLGPLPCLLKDPLVFCDTATHTHTPHHHPKLNLVSTFKPQFNPEGSLVITRGNNKAHIWSALNGALVHTLIHNDAEENAPYSIPRLVLQATFNNAGSRIATYANSNTITIWQTPEIPTESTNTPTNQELSQALLSFKTTCPTSPGDRTDLSFSPDDNHIMVTAGLYVLIFNALTGELHHKLKHQESDPHAYFCAMKASFNSDGTKILTLKKDSYNRHTATIWNLTTSKKTFSTSCSEYPPLWSADGSLFAVEDSYNKQISFYQTDGKEKNRFTFRKNDRTGNENRMTSMAFSPDGTMFAVSGTILMFKDELIKRNVKVQNNLCGSRHPVIYIYFIDTQTNTWQEQSGFEWWVEPTASSGPITNLSFSSDSTQLIGCIESRDDQPTRICIWDIITT